jgi:hypothetical protein
MCKTWSSESIAYVIVLSSKECRKITEYFRFQYSMKTSSARSGLWKPLLTCADTVQWGCGRRTFANTWIRLILLTPWRWVALRSRRSLSYSIIFQHFMEPEGSLPCSRGPSTGSCPENRWIQSIPPHRTFLKSILILSIHQFLSLPSGLFPSGIPTEHFNYSLLPVHAAWFAHLTLVDSILFGEDLTFHLHLRGTLLGLFDSEDGGDMFFRNVCFFYCCMCIRCQGNVLTEPLPSKERKYMSTLYRASA